MTLSRLCVSCGEVFRGRTIAWAPAPRCSSCAPASSLRAPIGPPADPPLALPEVTRANKVLVEAEAVRASLTSPDPAPKRRRAPASPEVERARDIAHGRLASLRVVMPSEEPTNLPELYIELELDDTNGDLDRVVATLTVSLGAVTAVAICEGLDPWHATTWVAAELSKLRASMLAGFVVHSTDSSVVAVRKGTLAAYVLVLRPIFGFYSMVGSVRPPHARFVSAPICWAASE